MSDYIARHESCTQPSVSPDANLRAYARENGLQTALIAAKFNGTQKLYTYWGHTGIKSGDVVEVLVPRRTVHMQDKKEVRVWAVIPATQFKSGAVRAAKHLVRVCGVAAKAQQRNAEAPMLQIWYNQVMRDIEPVPKTDHAKRCVTEIDGMLSDDQAVDTKVNWPLKADDRVDILARGSEVHRQVEKLRHEEQLRRLAEIYGHGDIPLGYHAVMEYKPLKAVREMFQQDFSPLGQRVAAYEGEKLRDYLISTSSFERMRDEWLKAAPPKARPLQIFIDEIVDFPLQQVRTGRTSGQSIPSNLPKENTVSAKVETVTYVTLPNGARRDASTMKPEEFFDAIALLEREVKKLDGIERKPRALQERMADLESQIDQLASLCDSLHAKKEEPTSDLAKTTYRDGSTKSQSGAALGGTQTYSATGSDDVGQDGSDRA